jgi:prepilin-type processing-associated H-X9-DG protein/prepilin-type N-terminal cleavage/methylation domain-containing protein
MSSTKSQNKRWAFNLIELLVVIAVVAILFALLLTVVSQSKAKALRVQCANNVRQLGAGLQTFVLDNNAYLEFISMDRRSWMGALQYVELSAAGKSPLSVWSGQGVWKCPAANKPANWPNNAGLYLSYGYNWVGMSARTDTNFLGLGGQYRDESFSMFPPVRESQIVSPVMAIGDGFHGGNGTIGEGWVLWRTYDVKDFLGSTARSRARHQGRANVVFCDGHVESPTLKFLFEDTSDAALVRWNRDHLPHREKLRHNSKARCVWACQFTGLNPYCGTEILWQTL